MNAEARSRAYYSIRDAFESVRVISGGEPWRRSVREFINRLPYVNSVAELESFDRLIRSPVFRTNRALVHQITLHDWSIVTMLCAHHEWTTANADDLSRTIFQMGVMIDALSLTPDKTGYYPTLEAHLLAEQAYKKQSDATVLYLNPYVHRAEVVAFVNEHATTAPHLVDYLTLTLWTKPDKEDYLDYLSQHALKDGWL